MVATSVTAPTHIPRKLQIAQEAVRVSLGDIRSLGDVAHAHERVPRNGKQDLRMVGDERPASARAERSRTLRSFLHYHRSARGCTHRPRRPSSAPSSPSHRQRRSRRLVAANISAGTRRGVSISSSSLPPCEYEATTVGRCAEDRFTAPSLSTARRGRPHVRPARPRSGARAWSAGGGNDPSCGARIRSPPNTESCGGSRAREARRDPQPSGPTAGARGRPPREPTRRHRPRLRAEARSQRDIVRDSCDVTGVDRVAGVTAASPSAGHCASEPPSRAPIAQSQRATATHRPRTGG